MLQIVRLSRDFAVYRRARLVFRGTLAECIAWRRNQ